MSHHKCEKMPMGTIIENVDTTFRPIMPAIFWKEPKTSEWRLMYSNYGYVNQVTVLFCPYCGKELEEPK